MIESGLGQDIIEGAVAASALAPLDESTGHATHTGGLCRNCLRQLTGHYCQNCGQKAAHLHKPIWELAEDLLHSVLHWDGRLGLTLRQLFLRPGTMTLDWVDGQQMRYVPPIRLFIFVSLLLIAVLAFSDVALVRIKQSNQPLDQSTMNHIIDGWHAKEKPSRSATDPEPKQNHKISVDIDTDDSSNNGTLVDVFTLIPAKLPQEDLIDVNTVKFNSKAKGGNDLGKSIMGKVNEISRNPRVANELISHSITRFMIIAVPLMAVVLKLLFIRRKKYLIEHVLFSLHVHTFFFVGLLICVLLTWISRGYIGGSALFGWLWGAYSLHFLIAQKKFYSQSWTKTIIKSVLITGLYTLGLLVSVSVALYLTTGGANITFGAT